ncbi:MAG: 50S ribosomal protein L18 [Parcubacteria group bacterium]|nr:50S ribosomal protein L18 [Parcubacteria group bacterium]
MTKIQNRIKRHRRIRAKIKGTAERPRLSVFKSNYHLYAQIINDDEGKTLVAASGKEIKLKNQTKKTLAYEVGKLIAKKAVEKSIINVVFDRSGYKFHGIILELTRGAKEGGLKF